MNITHNFKVSLSYKYTCDVEELHEALGVDDNTSTPWIKAFADIFGTPTSSYDGYIRDVTVSSDEIYIDAYIVEDKEKFNLLRDLSDINWRIVLSYLINMAIMKNAATIKQLQAVSISGLKYT